MVVTKVLLFQTDNRADLDYLVLTRRVNQQAVAYLNDRAKPRLARGEPLGITESTLKGGSIRMNSGEDECLRKSLNTFDPSSSPSLSFSYCFHHMQESSYPHIHPATGKINVVNDLLQGKLGTEGEPDIIVFLDSDAWIQNPVYLHELIVTFLVDNPEKHGCFSRDPYLSRNDFINSGSFILKNDEYVKTMYQSIQQQMNEDPSHHHNWSYDQYYIAREIHHRKEDFVILIPHVINTPEGQIIRHHWYKTHTMYGDLYELLDINRPFVKPDEPYQWDDKIDDRPYPNVQTYDYEYHR